MRQIEKKLNEHYSMSPWAPLVHAGFRAIWIAALVSYLGSWMQNVAASWLMTSLTKSPLLISLLQSASALPILLLAVPVGALADFADRKKLLIAAQMWMLAAAALLAAASMIGALSPYLLLFFTFLLAIGSALNNPIWQTLPSMLVPANELTEAVVLSSAAINVARALGPALGGLIVATNGPTTVFILNALSFGYVAFVVWKRMPTQKDIISVRPSLVEVIDNGVQYARYTPRLKAALLRAVIFTAGSSAFWALMPLVARDSLKLDAAEYGLLQTAVGAGAVAGLFVLPTIRKQVSRDTLFVLATILFSVSTIALAMVHLFWLLLIAMAVGGVGWLAALSTLNVAVQTSTPSWLQARALGIYLMIYQGGAAVASVAWGEAAQLLGVAHALLLASGVLIASLIAGKWLVIGTTAAGSLVPAPVWPEPAVTIEAIQGHGPIMVTIEYIVSNNAETDFLTSLSSLRKSRLRTGASRWAVFRDIGNREKFVETFLVPTWEGHVLQHEHLLPEDAELQKSVNRFHVGPGLPNVAHLITVNLGSSG